MTEEQARAKFPAYFANFKIPKWAKEQMLEVYRACATGKADQGSFMNTYEENGFKVCEGAQTDDPQQYSLSVYTKYKDVKRFMTMSSRYGIPHTIAKGATNPKHGICLETKVWMKMTGKKYRGSHVDWWLYKDAEPWIEFEVMESGC